MSRARRALSEFVIEGVASVLPFHRAVVNEGAFTAEQGFGVFTNWIETAFLECASFPRVEPVETGVVHSWIEIDGKRHRLGLPNGLFAGAAQPQAPQTVALAETDNAVTAPMPGTLQQWLVADGDVVSEGEAVALIEAMKMEMRVVAPLAGRLRIAVDPGAMLTAGGKLALVELE